MPAPHTQATRLLELLPLLEHAVVAEQRPADQVFAEHCRAHREWGARDRRLFGDTLFAFFRWRGWLRELPPASQLALAGWLEGLGQLALQQLAEQAGLKLSTAAPASLADKARALTALLGTEKQMEQLVPGWTLPALATGVTSEQYLDAFQRRPPVWLRVTPEQVPAALAFFNQKNPRATAHPRIAGAVAVAPPADLQGLRAATGIAAIVQDLASQVVGWLCAPQPGERWWDVCAGAGGKTLHLAALMQNRGLILATDVRAGVLRELEKRAAAAGVTIVRTRDAGRGTRDEGRGMGISDLRFTRDDWRKGTVEDAAGGRMSTAGLKKKLEGDACRAMVPRVTRDAGPETRDVFEGVLVDAPCSGLGTWNRNPDMRWRIAAGDVAAKAGVQHEVLARAARSVRPGGVLVYAVCTVTTAETTDVVEAFSRAHPGFTLESAAHPLTSERQPGTFWIWPWDGPCDGMFGARWRRRA